MNAGHEEEELKPYTEPEPDFNDTKRIGEYLTVLSGVVRTPDGSFSPPINREQFLFEKYLHSRLFFPQIYSKQYQFQVL